MKHNIRLATPADAAAILLIYIPYITNTAVTFEYDVPSIEQFEERIQSTMDKFPWFVYEINDVIVGYSYASSFRSRAAFNWDVESSIYINEKWHGKHIGETLYRLLLDATKTQGFYNMYAYITLPNPGSLALHKKLGFEQIGIYPKTGYKLGSWRDLASLCKRMNDSDETQPYTPWSKLDDTVKEQLLLKYNTEISERSK